MSYLYSSSSFFFDKMVNSVAWRVCVHRESDGTGIKLTHTPFCLLWETGRENVQQQQQQPKQTGQAFGRDSSFSFISFPFLSLFLFLFFLHFFVLSLGFTRSRKLRDDTHTRHRTARAARALSVFLFLFFSCCIIDDRKKEIKVPGMNNNM